MVEHGLGMGRFEDKDRSRSTEQMRTDKAQNWESADDLDAAADRIENGEEGIRIASGGRAWQSYTIGRNGETRWMLE